MCKDCGAYASSQCKTLKKPCPREWGGLRNGRRNGYNRFMAGKHPCLAKVLIEGQRAITAADIAEGVRSCARHEVYWSHSSEGGVKRPVSWRDTGQGPLPTHALGSGSGTPCGSSPGKVRRMGHEAQVDPRPVGLEEAWPDEFGRSEEVADEVADEGLEQWELLEFFGHE